MVSRGFALRRGFLLCDRWGHSGLIGATTTGITGTSSDISTSAVTARRIAS
jgi:hypothetical protein